MVFEMNFILRKLSICFFAIVCLAGVSFAQVGVLPGVVSDFELPRFDEDTGKKIWELFGKKAKFVDDKNIDVFDMRLVLFDKTTSVKRATISSPTARVNMSSRLGSSKDTLFVEGAEFNLSGKEWKWDGKNSVVEIFSDVEINFNPATDTVKSGDEKISVSKTKITGNTARLENGSKENKFYVVGNAAVRAENLSVDCHQIMVVSGGSQTKGTNDVNLIDAQGNVFMVRDNRTAKADKAVINPKENEAVLTGNPELEDLASKAKLSGDKIVFLKDKNSLKSYSSVNGKVRARTIFFHSKDDKSKPEKIEISSDEILLTSGEKENKFVFKGNVVVVGTEFSANCGSITVLAQSVDSKKPEVNVIKCRNSVKLKNQAGVAFASEMDIFPKESRTELRRNVKLVNTKDGTTLTADKLELFRDEDKGFATSKKFVNLYISEEATTGATSFGADTKQTRKTKKATKTNKKNTTGITVVSARSIDFSRKDGVARFDFKRDVSISSKQVRATCNNMIVYAHSEDNNTSKISKIEAFESVRVVQSEYTATSEYAVIYPKNEKSKDANVKNEHKFVELLVWDKKPNVRPKIMLPPMRNMGFEDSAISRKSRPKMTVITSNKQYLTSVNNVEKYFFEGDVKISATDTQGSCEKIEVVIAPPSSSERREISDIVLMNNVQMQQGLKEITCGNAHIYAKDEVAVLTKNPIVFNKEDNTRAAGEKIIYNKGSKLITVESNETQNQEDDFDDVQKKRPQIVLPEFNLKKVR